MAVRNKAAAKPESLPEKEVKHLFTKEQLLTSKRFEERKDLLSAVLSKDKQYTVSEAEKLIENFMKGKVK